jgi:hypothetical protein
MKQKIKLEIEKKNKEEFEHMEHKKSQEEVEQEKAIEKGEEKEERKQQVVAGNGVLVVSQVIQGRGLSQEKDDDALGAVLSTERGGQLEHIKVETRLIDENSW